MSLYDGLDSEPGCKPAQEVAGWGSSFKLLKTQKELNAKKQNALLSGRKRHTPTVGPVMDLRGKSKSSSDGAPIYFNQLTGKVEKASTPKHSSSPSALANMIIGDSTAISSMFLSAMDEYNPLHPNDYKEYTKVVKERRQKEREEERRKEMEERERRRRKRHACEGGGSDDDVPRKRVRRDDDDDEDAEEARKYEKLRSGALSGAAIAPPASLVEQDKKPLAAPEDDGPTGIEPKGFGFVSKSAGSVAVKIMSKMGYKMGHGLGKKEQGMSTALQVEKTGKRVGRIIHERDIPKEPAAPQQDMSNTNILPNPSKIVLLRNMVGPGEVDEELEQETMDECQKYGKCLKCLIFEMLDYTTDDEAVRIFVEFDKIDSAIKAIIDLNGRFFGGRSVKACFYNLDKYRRLDLADSTDL